MTANRTSRCQQWLNSINRLDSLGASERGEQPVLQLRASVADRQPLGNRMNGYTQ